ncbi:hypothetical protein NQ318_008257 [Aromia moschata]|uniref:DNA 3'-5' helicase n=1 Tax=Aromia moschata TaxID=1265417 RepID=A0AAV8Y7F6_9CUCU|nr:hypothetical protein NQ318_008257 [Aromia moschata]
MEDVLNDDVKKEFETEWSEDFGLDETEINLCTKECDEDPPGPEHLEVLSRCFGHKKFRPMQWKIISSIIKDRRDNCAIMTTGYGKSLCYQFPSTYTGGISIIISPLISLMEDQVLAMQVTNIPACLLGSANTKQKQTIDDIFEGKYTLIYLTPEFCTGEYGKELLRTIHKELSITLIAVDEAHCVSTWGHDFRFQYRKLGILKEIMPGIPILAVTATATSSVKYDIIKILKLKNPQVLCSGFDRPNLYLSVFMKSGDVINDFRKCMDRENGMWKFMGSTIVYCITRKETETLSAVLSGMGIKCLPYHAGLSLSVRKETHEQFLKDKIDVITATVAFGMGIDKPDIRNIIHYGASKSIEGYYQEVGRAGRDGQPSTCTTFYSNSDFEIHRYCETVERRIGGNKDNKKEMADMMLTYLRSRNCRREFILFHFEGKKVSVSRKSVYTCCDNCTRRVSTPSDSATYEGLDENGKYDFTEDARTFLAAVNELDGKFGIQNYILFLRGSKNSKIAGYARSSLHGSGNHKSEAWWKGLGALLEQENYLEKQYRKVNTISYFLTKVSKKGYTFLNNIKNGAKLITTPTPELFACLKTKANSWIQTSRPVTQRPATSTSSLIPTENKEDKSNEKLYRLLTNKRYEIATAQDCMPYLVASNKALMDMAKEKPTSLDRLRQCQFREDFLKVVKFYLNLDSDQQVKSIKDILISHPLPGIKTSMSAHASYSLFQTGLSVEEVAEKRGIVPTTVLTHLVDTMKSGYPIKLTDLRVTNEIKETIINATKSVDTGLSLLTPIKNACPPDITYNQIKAVITYLQIREHLKNLKIPYEEFETSESNAATSTKSAIDTSHRSDSPGMLTQLLSAMEECKDIPAKIESHDENSNFSEGIADADLALVCEQLETSISERNNRSDSETPPLKRSKFDDDDSFSALDSPPRQYLP